MSFELKDSGVVITGAGRGIGAALARKFKSSGARLVVADVDSSVESVAAELGAHAVVGDAASEEGVSRLVAEARSVLGEIDMYCANAGIAPMGGPDATEEDWARTWDVNVMSHVRAARALLPDWLERGRGHFLATVSAAGLLTSLGSASYSVTKHGALAFAEWLLATYKHRGIGVQAICPQGVRTQMLENTGPRGKFLMDESAITAEQVADTVVEALRGDSFLILPHPEVAGYYAARATQTDRWLGGMNKLQRKLEELR
ncbi:SDR family oxidoreductase [Kibdelosporangium persicum]|uniref:NADP-dependent 3-hydroxy acid dehydrogenase YdfG n=1 Tax=Kibdelosporangium persicum TaxID=2698649 RepID=A0ABX2FAG0_9PSEU|nr:SDR family oxidoreductase [Kibdelosporangium persicum]NRN68307.1 NADP-dependent 3-hydroxy acid dehydrogenase YdfG [Kibdelosporangium persicum]